MATQGPLLLFTLFIQAFCRAPEKYTLCTSSSLDLAYVYCGRTSHAPKIGVDFCDVRKNGSWNITASWIPSFDVNKLYAIVVTWHESMKISERTYILCSGHDDEFEFCGRLKGETILMEIKRRMVFHIVKKGTYTFALQGFVDDQKKDDLCLNFTITVKRDMGLM
ncbi:hypothetical protein NDU88_001861 [Pleurodeles waltl]|uniref:Lymphocyte antigen 96 n=1 Tax=Pleurodeles waltl TaxID=8319 RepID=A0AAV7UVX7_PLEWA|nr:hypothetical protein NDU88_001861 [Pleurodeles waltl]